jgi:catalase
MFWDFITLRPETTHQTSFLFSDRGIPDGYRHMNGYGSHTFKLVNDQGKAVYCKFHLKTDQGIKNLNAEKAHKLTADDPDYSIHDLYNAIAEQKFPSWSFYIQVMSFEEAEKFKWNPFDLTKVWPHSQFPLIPVGKLVLDRNPQNYFAEVEQIAFSPANLVPGIEPSPDKMLQARLFSYSDTHRHRLGANYPHIPVNCPMGVRRVNYMRDGPLSHDVIQGGAPNYFPNSFNGPKETMEADTSTFSVSGDVQRYDSSDDDNFSQVDLFWSKVLKPDERKRLADNIAAHLRNAEGFIQDRAVKNFSQVNPEFGRAIREGLNKTGKASGGQTHYKSTSNSYKHNSNL